MKIIRIIISFAIILLILNLILSFIMNYYVVPNEVYKLTDNNLIEDGSFENFNETVGDCCNSNPEKSKVFAFKSSDSIKDSYSLNLKSEFQCACYNKPITGYDKKEKIFFEFYYKGTNPRYCLWSEGDKKCLAAGTLDSGKSWNKMQKIVELSESSNLIYLFFYSDSEGSIIADNFYDGLSIKKITLLRNKSIFSNNEEYIFKTKKGNNVKGSLILEESGYEYYLTKGKPIITLKIPWYELIISIIMLFVSVRILYK
jgi:hypothetical protein